MNRESSERRAKFVVLSQRFKTEIIECNSRLDEHHAWIAELASAVERISSVVQTLETSVEKLHITCGSQLASLLEQERQAREEVLQIEIASHTRRVSTTLKEITEVTNQLNHERCTRFDALVHQLQDKGSSESDIEERRGRHAELSSAILHAF